MYKRWKKLREELNIQKEDIKVIRKRVMGETHLKQINVEDEEGNNLMPYEWDKFGPGSFFGQEASCWCHLPNPL